VFSRGDEDADVYRLVRGGARERLTTSTGVDAHAQFSADGRRVAFASDRTGTVEIWLANVDGTAERQLTRGPTSSQGSPRWSPDGSTMAFDAQDHNGDRHIWTIPVKGGEPRQLTTMPAEQSAPTWSHDGRWIYFSSGDRDHRDIWRVPAAGGAPKQISSSGSGVIAFESADGQHIVYKLRDGDGPLVEAPLAGGSPRPLIACVASFWGFSVQGEAIYYLPCDSERRGEVRIFDRKTGQDTTWGVLPGSNANAWDVPISPDQQSLLYDTLNFRANLWMLENFR
jgi:Tol biopolymer transport system component